MASRISNAESTWQGDIEDVAVENPKYAEIRASTKSRKLWPRARELVLALGMVMPSHLPTVHTLLKGQYMLARDLGQDHFVRELRAYADFMVDRDFVVQELGLGCKHYRRESEPTSGSTASSVSYTMDICRQTDPDIDRVKCDLGVKDFVLTPHAISSSADSKPRLPLPAKPSSADTNQSARDRSPHGDSKNHPPLPAKPSSADMNQSARDRSPHGDSKNHPPLLAKPSPVHMEVPPEVKMSPNTTQQSNRDRSMRIHTQQYSNHAWKSRSSICSQLHLHTTSSYVKMPVASGEEGTDSLLLSTSEIAPTKTSEMKQRTVQVKNRSLANFEITRDKGEEKYASKLSARRPRRPRPSCPISTGCERFHHKRRHVMRKHLPARFRDSRLTDADYHEKRMFALNWLAATLLDKDSTLDDLLAFVNRGPLLPPARTSALDNKWMTIMCRQESWPIPDEFILAPIITCKAVLAHWRTLAVLIAQLPEDKRSEFLKMDGLYKHAEVDDQSFNDTEVKG